MAERLDELAAVTKAYAKYSRSAFGFASVATGAWVGAVLLMRTLSAQWSNVLFAFVPAVWVVLLPRARAHYQKHGRVLEPEIDVEGLAADILNPLFLHVFALMGAVVLTYEQLGWARATGLLGWTGLIAAVTALLATPWLARRRLTSVIDWSYANGLAMFVVGSCTRQAGTMGVLWTAAVASLAVGSVALGTYQHVGFRRLERRLAALRGRS